MIREATIKDYAFVEKMATQFIETADHESRIGISPDKDTVMKLIVGMISDKDKVFLIEEGKGMIGGGLLPWAYNNDSMVAHELCWWVDPEIRGGTTGVRLFKAFEQWAKDKGVKALMMASIPWLKGEKVNTMYKKSGLVLLETSYGRAI